MIGGYLLNNREEYVTQPSPQVPYAYVNPPETKPPEYDITDAGVDIATKFEGFSPTAYYDKHGKRWTIGYGETHGVKPGDRITEQEARALLKKRLQGYAKYVNKIFPKKRLTNNQATSITDMIYNMGYAGFRKHGKVLIDAIKKNENENKIRRLWLRLNKSGNKVLPGLTRRRKATVNLFFTPDGMTYLDNMQERYTMPPDAFAYNNQPYITPSSRTTK